nr:hypothetical protein [Tanacetum cinerariifolium]
MADMTAPTGQPPTMAPPVVGFNSLVHSLRALSALRRFGLRTASTAAKPCQGDSSEFYLITGSIHTDQRGTVMKAAYYPDAGIEQMVPDQFWIEEECKYDIARLEDFQLGIESYQTQVNLTKPQWMATGFEYKHAYTVIESPMAVIFRDKYRVQMMMRYNEIHKFSDGTLQQIVEALDYRVKEFRINRLNPGLNMRFRTRKDVDRCNAFMFAIQRRLRTRRIFPNLESFVGGRVREGDYRLLKRTD